MEIGGDFQKLADFVTQKIGTETNGETLGICFRDEETGETTVNLGVIDYTEEEIRLVRIKFICEQGN